jgi:hypothetical protein
MAERKTAQWPARVENSGDLDNRRLGGLLVTICDTRHLTEDNTALALPLCVPVSRRFSPGKIFHLLSD